MSHLYLTKKKNKFIFLFCSSSPPEWRVEHCEIKHTGRKRLLQKNEPSVTITNTESQLKAILFE